MKTKLLKITILLCIILPTGTINAQSPKQKVLDRTSIGFEMTQSVRLNNWIYTIGNNADINQSYPSLVKQDLELNPVWVDHFSRSGSSYRNLGPFITTPDQNLLFTGYMGTSSADASLWLFKFDTLENIVWEKDLTTVGSQYPYSFIPNSSNGGIIMTTEFTTQNNIQYINIDGNGDTIWTKKLYSSTGDPIRQPKGIIDANGDLLTLLRNGNYTQIAKLNANGELISHFEIVDDLNVPFRLYDGISNGTHTYLAGRQNNGTFPSVLMKLDQTGNIVWCKNYPEIQVFFSLQIADNGDLITNGNMPIGELINKTELVRLDSNGIPLIAKSYGQLPASHILSSDILSVNNHYIVSGWRDYQATKTGYQITFDENLRSESCYEKNIGLTSSSVNATINALNTVTVESLQPDITFFGTPSSNSYISGGSFVHYNLNANISNEFIITGDDCGGACIGSIVANTTGGNPNYSYEWSNGETGDVASNLCSNEDVVLLTGDQLGCYVYDTVIVPQETPVNDICLVTVDATSTKNVVVWEKPVSNAIEGFTIYREVVGNYTIVGYVPYDSLSQFEDNTNGVNPNITSYRYKITTIDTCGNESDLSNFHETIHLTVNQGAGSTVNLIWDNYEGFPFSYNRILRDSLGDGNWVVKDSVSSNVFTWTDNNSPSSATAYMIEVVSPFICSATKAQDHNSTRSNMSTIFGGPVPDGISEINELHFNFYPNPTSGTIVITHSSGEPCDLTIQDVGGRVIDTYSVKSSETIDLSSYHDGLYLITLASEWKRITKRVIVTSGR